MEKQHRPKSRARMWGQGTATMSVTEFILEEVSSKFQRVLVTNHTMCAFLKSVRPISGALLYWKTPRHIPMHFKHVSVSSPMCKFPL